ncbi:MAG: hypothetical protein IJI45_14105, partial [Anaerolineaceae bacterium]|nr:hypothetical protein [Anaerolineaceae bacterium]
MKKICVAMVFMILLLSFNFAMADNGISRFLDSLFGKPGGDLTITEPKGIDVHIYEGKAIPLISKGTVTGGEFQYALGVAPAGSLDAPTNCVSSSECNAIGTNSFSGEVPEETDAGTYYVYWYVKGADNNYNDTVPKCLEATILPKTLTVTAAAVDRAYQAGNSEVTVNLSNLDGVVEGETITVPLNVTGRISSPDAGENKDVTLPEITLSGTKTENYTLTQPVNVKVNITKAQPEYATPANLTATYGQTLADVNLPEGWTWADSSGSVGNAGTNSFSATFTPDDTNNYATVTMDLSVTVAPAQGPSSLTENQKPQAVGNLVYDGANHALVTNPVELPEGYVTVQYSLDGNTWTVTVPEGNNADTYTVQVKYIGDTNHTTFEGESISVSIAKADLTALTVTPVTGTKYGDAFNEPQLTGNSGGGAVSWTYYINEECTTKTTPENSGASGEGGKPVNAGTWWVQAEVKQTQNYNSGTAKSSFTIAKASLTITANPKTITYGAVPANDGVTYSGFVNGEEANVLGGTLAYTYSYSQYGNVGAYTITPSGQTSSNYDITYETGTLTVEQKEIGITWGAKSFTYDGQSHVPTAVATGMVHDDVLGLTVTGEKTAAGTDYPATVTAITGDNAGNYKLPVDCTATFTIGQAALTVTAKPKTITYGDTPANDGVTYSGFVNGENENTTGILSGTLEYEYTYTQYGDVTDTSHNYTITPKGLTSANYSITFAPGTLTVEKKEIGIAWSEATFTYTGLAQAPTATATATVNNDSLTLTVSGAGTNAGNYTAEVTGIEGAKAGNYKLPESRTKAFTIGKAALTVKANANTITYGEAPSGAGVTYAGFVNEETENTAGVLTGTLAYDFTYAQFDDVSSESQSYTITPKGLSSSNYDISYEAGELTVIPLPAVIGWNQQTLSFTYDGDPHVPTANVTNRVNNDDVSVTVDGAQTNAGNYTATVTALSGEKAGNYQLPSGTVTTGFSIVKANMDNITAAGYDAPYDGAAHGITLTGVPIDAVVKYGESADNCTHDSLEYTDVTEKTVYYQVTKANHNSVTGSATVKITAKEIGISWGETTFTYTGLAQAPTATATETVNNDSLTLTVSGAETNAGNYTAEVTGIEGDKAGNYKLPENIRQIFTIGKATLTVTANNNTITYGDVPANTGVEYDGFVNNETAGILTGELTYSYSYSQYEPVGDNYTITPGGLSSNNYAFSYVSGTLTVSKKTIGISWGTADLTYTGLSQAPTAMASGMMNGDELGLTVDGARIQAGSNYTATVTGITGVNADNYMLPDENLSVTFNIAKAALTVTAHDKTITYGDGPANTGVEYDGFVNNEAENVLTGDLTYSYNYSQYEAVGNAYTITPGGLSSVNYEIAFEPGNLTVMQKEIGITWGNRSFTYNGKAQIPEASVSGEVNNDVLTLTVEGAQINVGNNYSANVTAINGTKAGNYKLPSDTGTTFEITPASLIVRAQKKTITYGEEPSNAGVTFSGFVNGETPNVLGETLAYTYSYTRYGNVGIYMITPSGLTSSNYDITYEDGTLTVEKKVIGITWGDKSFTYDGQSHVPTAAAAGMVNNDTLDLTVTGEKTAAGTDYPATVTAITGDKAGNYKLPEDCTTTFTIGKAALTVTAKPKTITYGDAPANDGVTYSGFVTGENENTSGVLGGTLEYEYTYTQYGDVTGTSNSYTITPKGLTSENYYITFGLGTLTVEKKEIGIAWSENPAVFTYNGTPQAPTATATETVNNDSVTLTVIGAGTNAGNYTAEVTGIEGAKAGNYKLSGNKTKAFTIGQATLTVTANNKTITYGEAPSAAGVTYAGFVNGENENTEGVLTGTLAYDFTYAQFGDVSSESKSYMITPKGLSSSNYNISYEAGTLTVIPLTAVIEWDPQTLSFTYDGDSHVPTANVTNRVNNDDVSVTVDGEQPNAGNYTATVTALSGGKAGNYQLPSETVTTEYTIVKADMGNITATGYDAPYDGAAHGITLTGVPDDAVVKYGESAGNCTQDSLKYKDVTEKTVYYQVTKANHNPVTGSATVKITAKEIGISWGETNFTYDGTPHVPTATLSGVVNGDTCNVTVTGSQTNVGTYSALAALDNSNYTLATDTTNFTISEVDKIALNSVISNAAEYYEQIRTNYPDIAAALQNALTNANAVSDNQNVTEDTVRDAVTALNAALDKAKADVKDADDTAAAAPVSAMIDALPLAESITVDDKNAIEAARDAYDDLTDDQKAKVGSERLAKLEADEAALAAALAAKEAEDTAAANAVINMINALPSAENVTVDHKDAIEAARETYNDLTDDQKAKVPQEVLQKLAADEAALAEKLREKDEADTAAADAVTALINALPSAENVTVNDKEAIETARDAYDDLTDDQKQKVAPETLAKLVADENALAEKLREKDEEDTAAANAVINMINALPEAENVQLTDQADIEAARQAYDALTPDQKAKIEPDVYGKLTADETKLAQLLADKEAADKAAADAVIAGINNLPAASEVTADDKADIEAARSAYENLTEDQKARIPQETLDKLAADEIALDQKLREKEAADTAAAGNVTDLINALPDLEDVTVNDKDAIEAARAAYNALTDDQKTKISENTLAKLEADEDALAAAQAEAEKEAADAAAANAAADLINALPDPDDVTVNDKDAIEAAREAYNRLTADQKAKVTPETIAKLEADEVALAAAQAEAEKEAADAAAAGSVTN